MITSIPTESGALLAERHTVGSRGRAPGGDLEVAPGS